MHLHPYFSGKYKRKFEQGSLDLVDDMRTYEQNREDTYRISKDGAYKYAVPEDTIFAFGTHKIPVIPINQKHRKDYASIFEQWKQKVQESAKAS